MNISTCLAGGAMPVGLQFGGAWSDAFLVRDMVEELH